MKSRVMRVSVSTLFHCVIIICSIVLLSSLSYCLLNSFRTMKNSILLKIGNLGRTKSLKLYTFIYHQATWLARTLLCRYDESARKSAKDIL